MVKYLSNVVTQSLQGITKCPMGILLEAFGIGAAYGEGLYINSLQNLVGTTEQGVST